LSAILNLARASLLGGDITCTATTPYLLADGPQGVTVTSSGDNLAVSPSADGLAELVTRRFHLDLDASAVTAAFERSALTDVLEPNAWVRRPAAADLWSYCLIFLCGANPDAPSVTKLFAELGQADGQLQIAPGPTDVLAAGDRRIMSCGVAPHRVANVLGLARAFAATPERYDEVSLRALPADEAVARVAELPHIGSTRARAISSTALGHDDALPDLARPG